MLMKLITEFAKKAGFHIDDYDKNIYPEVYGNMYINRELKEYTELVVQHCALVIDDLVAQRIPASEYSDRLKDHFGV